MIVSRTPFRISLFGGGTDYPSWYQKHGGSVLSATIDKYCYLTCRHLPPFFDHRYRVVYSNIESVRSIDEIIHPAARETLRYMKSDHGVEIHHDGDLPARSGMGSSSAFTVGLLHSLYALKGQIPSKHQLALESIHIEQEVLRETVGSQDQVSAAYGGINHMTFLPNGEVVVRPLTVVRDRVRELNSHLMLYYTGAARTASDVAASYIETLAQRSAQFGRITRMVDEALGILTGGGDLRPLGELLHESWMIKRSLSSRVSTSLVEGVYDAARKAGALGGKLIGAGGGGFMLLFVEPERQAAVRAKLQRFLHVPFQFEFSGSQIIFFTPEPDYRTEEAARRARDEEIFRELG
jgi:D-glycero-alpha-D-manno-heptose-7-phosphate kinase